MNLGRMIYIFKESPWSISTGYLEHDHYTIEIEGQILSSLSRIRYFFFYVTHITWHSEDTKYAKGILSRWTLYMKIKSYLTIYNHLSRDIKYMQNLKSINLIYSHWFWYTVNYRCLFWKLTRQKLEIGSSR